MQPREKLLTRRLVDASGQSKARVGAVRRDTQGSEGWLTQLGAELAKGDVDDEGGILGLELDGEWWVKARIVDAPAGAPTYLCCRGKGRVVEYRDQTF